MTSYFEKRKKNKLYNQWVKESELPPENVPGDLEEKANYHKPADENGEERLLDIKNSLSIHLTMRHLLYLVLIIIVLIITTASLATILVMHSC